MLTLAKRPGRPNYYLRGTVQGQHIFASTGTSDRRQAEAIRIRFESELQDRHAYGRAATLTFAEAALTYMQGGGEARYLGRLLDHFGEDALLADIDNAACARAARALYPAAAPATINRQLVTPLSAVIAMAAAEGLTPPRRLRRWKGGAARTRWLTPEEAEALLAAAGPRLVQLLGVFLGGGARVSEVLGIEAQFFYPDSGEVWLPDTKNDHPRMLRLPSRAIDLIRSGPLAPAGAIFRTPAGLPYRASAQGGYGGQIKSAFHRARDQAGLGREVTPHVLRHTWATWFYAATHDFGGLLDIGGWQNADMAQRYRKIAPADLPARLADHGWDFNDLRRQPAPAPQPGFLRLVR